MYTAAALDVPIALSRLTCDEHGIGIFASVPARCDIKKIMLGLRYLSVKCDRLASPKDAQESFSQVSSLFRLPSQVFQQTVAADALREIVRSVLQESEAVRSSKSLTKNMSLDLSSAGQAVLEDEGRTRSGLRVNCWPRFVLRGV